MAALPLAHADVALQLFPLLLKCLLFGLRCSLSVPVRRDAARWKSRARAEPPRRPRSPSRGSRGSQRFRRRWFVFRIVFRIVFRERSLYGEIRVLDSLVIVFH